MFAKNILIGYSPSNYDEKSFPALLKNKDFFVGLIRINLSSLILWLKEYIQIKEKNFTFDKDPGALTLTCHWSLKNGPCQILIFDKIYTLIDEIWTLSGTKSEKILKVNSKKGKN